MKKITLCQLKVRNYVMKTNKSAALRGELSERKCSGFHALKVNYLEKTPRIASVRNALGTQLFEIIISLNVVPVVLVNNKTIM